MRQFIIILVVIATVSLTAHGAIVEPLEVEAVVINSAGVEVSRVVAFVPFASLAGSVSVMRWDFVSGVAPGDGLQTFTSPWFNRLLVIVDGESFVIAQVDWFAPMGLADVVALGVSEFVTTTGFTVRVGRPADLVRLEMAESIAAAMVNDPEEEVIVKIMGVFLGLLVGLQIYQIIATSWRRQSWEL